MSYVNRGFALFSKQTLRAGVVGVSAAVLVCGTLQSCGRIGNKDAASVPAKLQISSMSSREAVADFRQIVETFRRNYGPLKYKEERFGYSFDELAAQAELELRKVKTDGEYFEIYSRFLANFRDGHVSFRAPVLSSVKAVSAEIPIYLVPLEGRAFVEVIDESLAIYNISVGDEILLVDGENPVDIAAKISQLRSSGNEESDKHFVVGSFFRQNYFGKLYPTGNAASIVVQKPNGAKFTVSIPWRRKDDLGIEKDKIPSNKGFAGADTQLWADVTDDLSFAGRVKMGAKDPFFVTNETKKEFKFAEIVPSTEFLKKFGIEKAAPIFAALYRFESKNVLLIRQPGYSAAPGFTIADHISTYKAILAQYEDLADVLVIDQTHNPGGSVSYVSELARLFAVKPMGNFVQAQRADRKWVEDFRQSARDTQSTSPELSRVAVETAKTIEAAYDSGEFLSKPVAFDGQLMLSAGNYVWKKPTLVLINELAGSGGDAFPMLLKAAGAAKLFGNRTMGLGGSVEEETLINSRATFRVTRGLFTAYKPSETYALADFVENNGVTPDIPFSVSVEDFRAGYVQYVKAFSNEAVKLLLAE